MNWKLILRQRHLLLRTAASSPCWPPGGRLAPCFLTVSTVRPPPFILRWSSGAVAAQLPGPPSSHVVISFYKFLTIANPDKLKDQFVRLMSELDGRGRIYMNSIGINAQLCLPRASWEPFLAFLHQQLPADLDLKTQPSCGQVFNRVRVRHGKLLEGLDDKFDASRSGQHLGGGWHFL